MTEKPTFREAVSTQDWAEEKAREIAANSPLICGPCGGPLREDCGHRANGVPGCCIPAGDDLEAAIAQALREAYERGATEMRTSAAKVADDQATDLNAWSERLKVSGDQDGMYRANTAYHRVVAVAELVRALPTSPTEPK